MTQRGAARAARRATAVVALAALWWAQPSPALASEASADVLVTLRSDAVGAAAAGTGGHVVDRISDDTVVVRVPGMSIDGAIAALAHHHGVQRAQANMSYHASFAANDPCLSTSCDGSRQWNVQKVRAPEAWDATTGSQQVPIAVLDSGVDASHPDLAGRVQVGPNYSDDADPSDLNGHGTHVTGILAATTNNGIGIAGVAWTSPVTSVKVLNHNGDGSTVSLSKGLHWAADHGMRIASLSLTGNAPDPTLQDAVVYAQHHGMLVVAAAGNAASNAKTYPAAIPGVLSVGATNSFDQLSWFTNYGSWVDIAAPGESITSTWSSAVDPSRPYAVESGTSMATPLVAGIAALTWSVHPYLSPLGVRDRLMTTAHKINGSGSAVVSGRIDAAGAVLGQSDGYRLVASDGGLFSFGSTFQGSAADDRSMAGAVVAAATPGSSVGYWMTTSDGRARAFGDAPAVGSASAMRLNRPIVGMAATGSGNGFWLTATDGGVFTYGDAQFYGSTGNIRLNQPVVTMLSTASGAGYWLVAADGGVFAYGDAQFYGSTGSIRLNQPIVAALRTVTGRGYWLIASDGGVFAYGDAQFYGSTGSIRLNQPIVGAAPSVSGNGYRLVASDGGVFCFGDASFKGSTGGMRLNRPIVSILGD